MACLIFEIAEHGAMSRFRVLAVRHDATHEYPITLVREECTCSDHSSLFKVWTGKFHGSYFWRHAN